MGRSSLSVAVAISTPILYSSLGLTSKLNLKFGRIGELDSGDDLFDLMKNVKINITIENLDSLFTFCSTSCCSKYLVHFILPVIIAKYSWRAFSFRRCHIETCVCNCINIITVVVSSLTPKGMIRESMTTPINSSCFPLELKSRGRSTNNILNIHWISYWHWYIYKFTRMWSFWKVVYLTIHLVARSNRIGHISSRRNSPRVWRFSTLDIISPYMISDLVLEHFVRRSNLKSRTYTASFISSYIEICLSRIRKNVSHFRRVILTTLIKLPLSVLFHFYILSLNKYDFIARNHFWFR